MNIGLFIKDFAVGKKFSKDGLPTKSGAEFHGENHALQLIKRGHEVTIMAKKRYWFTKARENLNGIDLVRLHAPFRWLEIWIRLLTTHKSIDTFYILGKPDFAVWAILYAKIFRKRVVMALTGKAELFVREDNWRNKVFTKCDHYLALSREIHDGFVERAKIPSDRITILGQGIATAKFPRLSVVEKQELRQQYGFAKDSKILLFCARVVLDKGIDVVMRIWPRLHEEFPEGRLVVVGGGQNNLLEKLKILAAECDESITVAGEVDSPVPYYQISDVYIFPSLHEGLPTTLMEAMSCGLPGVVSDIGGCRDLIEQGKSGYLNPVGDDESFYNHVRNLFMDQEKRQSLGEYASVFAYQNCDYSNVIAKLEQILANGR